MAQYSANVNLLAPYAGGSGCYAEIIPSATDWPIITSLTVVIGGGNPTPYQIGIGRPAAMGVGPKTTYALIPHDPNSPPTTVVIATDWKKPPTAPTQFMRTLLFNTGSAPSQEETLIFPNGLRLKPGTSLVIHVSSIQISGCPMRLGVELDI